MIHRLFKPIVDLRMGWILIASLVFFLTGAGLVGAAETKAANVPATSKLPTPKSAALSSSGVVCLSCPAPEYPIEAAQRGLRGVVDLELTVSEDGRVEEVKVLAAPCDELEAASVKAAQGWTFRPAMRDGKPVREVVQVPVVFRLFQSHARLRQLPASTPASSAPKAR